MRQDRIIQGLEDNIAVFNGLFSGMTEREYLWRNTKGKWNLLEILCHLFDEEREDFRTRVALVLSNPDTPLPKIDPEGWVKARSYEKQDFELKLDEFIQERKNSVEWLHSLKEPKWENAYQHPNFGALSAKMFLANWLAHDLLHIRQVLKIKYDYLKIASKQNLLYAGDW